jgi:hypothetical protein
LQPEAHGSAVVFIQKVVHCRQVQPENHEVQGDAAKGPDVEAGVFYFGRKLVKRDAPPKPAERLLVCCFEINRNV